MFSRTILNIIHSSIQLDVYCNDWPSRVTQMTRQGRPPLLCQRNTRLTPGSTKRERKRVSRLLSIHVSWLVVTQGRSRKHLTNQEICIPKEIPLFDTCTYRLNTFTSNDAMVKAPSTIHDEKSPIGWRKIHVCPYSGESSPILHTIPVT